MYPSKDTLIPPKQLPRKPYYFAQNHGVTWSVYEQDIVNNHKKALLHNCEEWEARAIAAILRG